MKLIKDTCQELLFFCWSLCLEIKLKFVIILLSFQRCNQHKFLNLQITITNLRWQKISNRFPQFFQQDEDEVVNQSLLYHKLFMQIQSTPVLCTFSPLSSVDYNAFYTLPSTVLYIDKAVDIILIKCFISSLSTKIKMEK